MEDNVSTMASEPVAAYSMTSYNDVMDYMHSIHISREDKEKVAKRLTIEVSQPALAEAYERIDHLSTLPKDWDGHGALPISYKVLRNIKRVLMLSQNSDWEHWMIAPDTNATLCIESKTTGAVISLGAYEYSYFAKIDGVRYGESHIDFDPESFLELIKNIKKGQLLKAGPTSEEVSGDTILLEVRKELQSLSSVEECKIVE